MRTATCFLMLLYPHHKSLGGEAGHLANFQVSGTDSARLVVASLDLASVKSVQLLTQSRRTLGLPFACLIAMASNAIELGFSCS